MDEKDVGDAAQHGMSLFLVDDNRLLAVVAAGGHDREIDLRQEQGVQGRCRQQEADVIQVGGDSRSEAAVGKHLQQDNGVFGTGQQFRLDRTDAGQSASGLERSRHHGQGLGGANLALRRRATASSASARTRS